MNNKSTIYNHIHVRYILTRRIEKVIPLRRLTTIVMPHRGPRASLRQAKVPAPVPAASVTTSTVNDFRRMSPIQILKHGLTNNLWKKLGWLKVLLKAEGIIDGSKQSMKEMCWSYYKSQMLYIEAMQDAKEDAEFDPRRSEHVTGKDGRFVCKKNHTSKPKNPLTVTYLCFAFDIPYATFKRWKKDAFVSKVYVPETKGKSVLTDKKLATQVYNPRKMYVTHGMAAWLDKHPAKKYDGEKCNQPSGSKILTPNDNLNSQLFLKGETQSAERTVAHIRGRRKRAL